MKHRRRGKIYPGDKDVWYALGSVPEGTVSIGDEVELYDVENGVSVNLRVTKGTKCDEDCWCYKHMESSSCHSIFGCVNPRACVRVVIVGDLMEEV
jgi:hypothetical protein